MPKIYLIEMGYIQKRNIDLHELEFKRKAKLSGSVAVKDGIM
jgi:hypothetical protein